MKFSAYLADKALFLLCSVLFWLLFCFFLMVLGMGIPLLALISVLYILSVSVPLCIDYLRRRRFYQQAEQTMEQLENKNLLTELIRRPSFSEGQLFYDLMRDANKNMLEQINVYRYRQQDYREYIEMWVHEIKTPIASAKLTMENHPGPASDSVAEDLDAIERFVEQALYVSRGDSVEKDYLLRKVALNEVVFAAVRRYAKLCISRHITVQTERLDGAVYTDGKWLEFILGQILINAIQYAPPKQGRIRIDACWHADSVVLSIVDNGPGIPLQDLPRLFEKGFTGHNGRQQNKKATGMGLYLCKTLCDKLGHGLQVYSTWGEGTEVRITFPLSSLTEQIFSS